MSIKLDTNSKEFVAAIELLYHENKEIRQGALKAVVGMFTQKTSLSKSDVKSAFAGQQRVLVQQPAERGNRGSNKKKEDARIEAIKAKYPKADQRGKDSEYAKEITAMRAVIKAEKKKS